MSDLARIIEKRDDQGPALEALERIVSAIRVGDIVITGYVSMTDEPFPGSASVRLWLKEAK